MGQGDPEAKQKFILCLLLLQGPAPGPAWLPSVTPGLTPACKVLIWQGQALGPVADEDDEDRAAGQQPQEPAVRPPAPNLAGLQFHCLR